MTFRLGLDASISRGEDPARPLISNYTYNDRLNEMSLIESARVVKLVDAGDSKSPAARRAGSIPAPGTTLYSHCFLYMIFRLYPIMRGMSIHYTQLITPFRPNRAKALIR
jgi:hypothetical protein